MPFGLKTAPSTFQRLMDQVLSGLQGLELFVYRDDIVVYYYVYPKKRDHIFRPCVITENGVKPDPRQIDAVKNSPRPKTRKNVKQFLGLIGYYRRFIPEFAKLAKPLTVLTKLGVKFRWDEAQQRAFEKMQDLIITDPIL